MQFCIKLRFFFTSNKTLNQSKKMYNSFALHSIYASCIIFKVLLSFQAIYIMHKFTILRKLIAIKECIHLKQSFQWDRRLKDKPFRRSIFLENNCKVVLCGRLQDVTSYVTKVLFSRRIFESNQVVNSHFSKLFK